MHGHTIVNSNRTLDGRFEIALSRILEDGTIQLQPIGNRIVIEDEVEEFSPFHKKNIGFIDAHGEQLMDLDGDGILDLFIVQGGNRGELVRNPKMQDNLLFFGEINDKKLVLRGGRKQGFDAGLHGRNGRGRQPFIFGKELGNTSTRLFLLLMSHAFFRCKWRWFARYIYCSIEAD